MIMKPQPNIRKYGKPPFTAALIHGGPGAAGEMAPVSQQLGKTRGALEPLQTADSVQGQIDELISQLKRHARTPVTLVGFSWGAWLSLLAAAKAPSLVEKLILIGCGPLSEEYSGSTRENRLKRLQGADRRELTVLMGELDDPAKIFSTEKADRLRQLIQKTDSFDPLCSNGNSIAFQADIAKRVWQEARLWRQQEKLLRAAAKVRCPVTFLHGQHDPHPAEGILMPLADVMNAFTFIMLHECGHKPWIERRVRDRFFHILEDQLMKN
ncbi:MAG TPA: alpha/beta hydrolase [bacterium]|nr:alpha/beta hydrolase [bacterium]